MKGFDEEYQAKSYYYIYQSSSRIFAEGEVRLISTHTYIESDIVLYFEERFTSNFFSNFHFPPNDQPVKTHTKQPSSPSSSLRISLAALLATA